MKIEKLPLPENMKDERYFLICNLNSDRCGSYYYFYATADSTNEEIFQYAIETIERKTKLYLQRPSSIFLNPTPKWHNSIKVIELTRKITKLQEPDKYGRVYTNIWKTKRNGLKFTLVRNWIKMKFNDVSIKSYTSYNFGKIQN
jgi:hypothetical protein